MGRPWAHLDAAGYQQAKPGCGPSCAASSTDLRSRFDVVICEGAGSPAEINLLDGDIVNLRVARAAGLPAIVVGDIDRGGVFAALYGTVALLPPRAARDRCRALSSTSSGAIRPSWATAPGSCSRRTGVPTLGVLPWLDGLGIDAEDSLALGGASVGPARGGRPARAGGSRRGRHPPSRASPTSPTSTRWPSSPGCGSGWWISAAALGRPDLVVLPGTKATVADLDWLRTTGLADGIKGLADRPPGPTILGICGGYQMLGQTVEDPASVESAAPSAVRGLQLLPVRTEFHPVKVTRQVRASALGQPVAGFEIHHGRTAPVAPWIQCESGSEGSSARDGGVVGTSLHGLFDSDGFRAAFLGAVAVRSGRTWVPSGQSFSAARERQADTLADTLEAHLDISAIEKLIWSARGQKEGPH